MKEVYVFGTDKYRLYKNVKMEYQVSPSQTKISKHTVFIYNDKVGMWEKYPCNDTITECPVCGRKFRAYYIPGTTWIAFCSLECEEKFTEKYRELGDLFATLTYFKNLRLKR